MKWYIIFPVKVIVVLLLNSFSILWAQDSICIGSEGFLSPQKEKEYYAKYTPVIIPEFFLLGMFQESYLAGLISYDVNKKRIDYFQDYEKNYVYVLKEYIRKHLNIDISIVEEERGGMVIYSTELLKVMNIFFDENKSLNMGLLNSDEKICSYLAGAYYRRSLITESKKYYVIYDHNMNSVYCLLKKAGCNNILYTASNTVPGYYLFYFEPPYYLKKYLDIVRDEVNAPYLLTEDYKIRNEEYRNSEIKEGKNKKVKNKGSSLSDRLKMADPAFNLWKKD